MEKTIFFAFIFFAFLSGCARVFVTDTLGMDYWKNYYQEKIGKGNIITDAGPIWTIEQKKNGGFLYKEYFYDTKVIVEEFECAKRDLSSKNGYFKTYSMDGKLWTEGQFKDGKSTGTWKRFYPKEGVLKEIGDYRNDLRVGKWTEYRNNGKVMEESHFKNDKLHGWRICYNPEGDLRFKQRFEEGEMVEMESVEEQPEIISEKMAQFAEGEAALYRYLSNNLTYPAAAHELGIAGRVIVQFVVEKDGSINLVEALRAPSQDILDEAVRVVKSLPKWIPAEQNGKIVRQMYTLPIKFNLR